jgi:hypothetical protein
MRILATTCAAIGALALTAGIGSAQNSAYCEQQANAAANQIAKPGAGGLIGGALGALGGVGLGSALGQGSEAKVLGGIAGGVAGAAVGTNVQRKKRDQVYRDTYEYCMSQAAPAAYAPPPPAGSPQWVTVCSSKYKSFIADPNSPYFGTYQPFAYPDGSYPPRRPCELP